MVTYEGVNYADTQASPQTLIDQGQFDAHSFKTIDSFVLTADIGAGDIILMGGPIPEGAILIDAAITSAALGGSCTIDVGWQASLDTFGNTLEAAAPTGFFSALPVSSATVAKAHGSTYEGSFYLKKLAGSVQPVIAEHAASSGATGAKISLEISYVRAC